MSIGDDYQGGTFTAHAEGDPPRVVRLPRPPLGIKPRSVWLAQRSAELIAALSRYAASEPAAEGVEQMAEWAEELADTLREEVAAVEREVFRHQHRSAA